MSESTLTDNLNNLQPTQFKIVIDRKRFGNFVFFAQGIDMPDISSGPAVVQYKKTDAYFPGDKIEYGDLTINAIIDEDLNIYKEIYDWMMTAHENNYTKNANERLQEYDISIVILSNNNNKTNEITFKAAFPTTIGGVTFSTSNQETYILLPVTFRYTGMKIK